MEPVIMYIHVMGIYVGLFSFPSDRIMIRVRLGAHAAFFTFFFLLIHQVLTLPTCTPRFYKPSSSRRSKEHPGKWKEGGHWRQASGRREQLEQLQRRREGELNILLKYAYIQFKYPAFRFSYIVLAATYILSTYVRYVYKRRSFQSSLIMIVI